MASPQATYIVSEASSSDNSGSSPLPPHTGILRDDTLIIRKLFGLVERDETSTTWPIFREPKVADVVLVALDVDAFGEAYDKQLADQRIHIGLSMLDTRTLLQVERGDVDRPIDVIKSYQFTIGQSSKIRKVAKQLVFGESEPVDETILKSRFNSLIPKDRDIVTVFHQAAHDQAFLRRLEIDLQPVSEIDTVKAAQFPLRLSYRLSLGSLLKRLDIPFKYLHTAGNDAHFILRALLMLVVVDAETLQDYNTNKGIFNTLKMICYTSLPITQWEIHKAHIEAKEQEKKDVKGRRKVRQREKVLRRKLAREDSSKTGHELGRANAHQD